MVAITTLWTPIVLAAVAVFLASSIVHMVLGYHWNDFRALPNQSAVLEALRGFNLPPGEYALPKPEKGQMRSPEYKALYARGPVAMMNIWGGGSMSMSKNLVQWFVYLLVV